MFRHYKCIGATGLIRHIHPFAKSVRIGRDSLHLIFFTFCIVGSCYNCYHVSGCHCPSMGFIQIFAVRRLSARCQCSHVIIMLNICSCINLQNRNQISSCRSAHRIRCEMIRCADHLLHSFLCIDQMQNTLL